MKIAFVVGLVVLVVLGLDRLFLFFESRGWMYWRRSKGGGSGAAGNALVEMHAAFDPGARAVIEERSREASVEDTTGDGTLTFAEDGAVPDATGGSEEAPLPPPSSSRGARRSSPPLSAGTSSGTSG